MNHPVDDNAYGSSIASPIASETECQEGGRVASRPLEENERSREDTSCIGREEDFYNAHRERLRLRQRQRHIDCDDDGPQSHCSGTGSKATRGLEPGGSTPGALQIRTRAQMLALRMPVEGLEVSPTLTEINSEATPMFHMSSVDDVPIATIQAIFDEADTSRIAESNTNQIWHSSRNVIPPLLVGLLVLCCAITIALVVILSKGTKGTRSDGQNPPVVSKDPCFFIDQDYLEYSDILKQCACNGTVQILSNESRAAFVTIQATLDLTIPKTDIFSCAPENLSLLLLALQDSNVSDEVLLNQYLLNLLYLSTNGTQWKRRDGWLEANETCTCCFYGVECEGDSIVSIALSLNGLLGTIPPALGRLTALRKLDLSDNHISGTIPSELGQCTNLVHLILQENYMSESIPSELGRLTMLQEFSVVNNILYGELLSELGMLTDLKTLHLGFNSMSGTIPSEFGKLTQLITLILSPNSFVINGTFPLWHVSTLQEVIALEMDISGTIPASPLSLMTGLISFHMDDNILSGTLPSELGLLTSLEMFSITNNKIKGTIPAELGACTKLVELLLNENDITGIVPSVTEEPSGVCSLHQRGHLIDFETDCSSQVSCPANCCTSCSK